MQRRLILFITILLTTLLKAANTPEMAERIKYKQAPAFIYRVTLADKKGTPYSLHHPSRFLSRRSIERRKRQHLPLDSTDLPVSPSYERQIKASGATIIGRSRWQNTLLVWLKDSSHIAQLRTLPFVKACRMVWQAPDSITPSAERTKYHDHFEEHHKGDQLYGQSFHQIESLGGNRLAFGRATCRLGILPRTALNHRIAHSLVALRLERLLLALVDDLLHDDIRLGHIIRLRDHIGHIMFVLVT